MAVAITGKTLRNLRTGLASKGSAANVLNSLNDAGADGSVAATSGVFTGAVTVGTTLGVTGAVTLSSTAAVTGALTPTGGIAAAGGFSFSPRLCHTGGMGATISTQGTNLTVVVTELYVAELFIPANCTITGASIFWGDATEGNAKVCLFDSAGTRVAISASTDVSGHTVDAYSTRIPFSATYAAKGPATYYLGVIADNTAHRINTHVLGDFGAGKITGLVYATEAGYASITVPTTFTTGLGPIGSVY